MNQRWTDVSKYVLLVGVLLLLSWWLTDVPTGWLPERLEAFVESVGGALLGSAISAATAAMIIVYALSVRRRRRLQAREYAAIRRESSRRPGLQIGDLTIPNIVVVAAMTKEQEGERVRFEFAPLDSGPARKPEGWASLEAGRLAEMTEEALDRGRPFTDDDAVDLVRAGISGSRRQSIDGIVRYRLVPRVTTYHVWAATSGSLDRTLTEGEEAAIDGDGTSLRERWKLAPRRLEDVSSLPAPAKVGCGVVVVTSDDQMVLGLRGLTFVAGGDDVGDRSTAAVHFVAEGMIPTDTDTSGRLNAEVTARRGLMEELAIGDAGAGLVEITQLDCAGMFFDTQRWQPAFAYVARVSATYDELATLVHSARDFWEADQLIPLPFDISSPATRRLLLDDHESFHFASNHAQALAYFALLHEFGLNDMRDAMRRSRRGRAVRAVSVAAR